MLTRHLSEIPRIRLRLWFDRHAASQQDAKAGAKPIQSCQSRGAGAFGAVLEYKGGHRCVELRDKAA